MSLSVLAKLVVSLISQRSVTKSSGLGALGSNPASVIYHHIILVTRCL